MVSISGQRTDVNHPHVVAANSDVTAAENVWSRGSLLVRSASTLESNNTPKLTMQRSSDIDNNVPSSVALGPVVGLDFGTCNSVISIWMDAAGYAASVPSSASGELSTPTTVTFMRLPATAIPSPSSSTSSTSSTSASTSAEDVEVALASAVVGLCGPSAPPETLTNIKTKLGRGGISSSSSSSSGGGGGAIGAVTEVSTVLDSVVCRVAATIPHHNATSNTAAPTSATPTAATMGLTTSPTQYRVSAEALAGRVMSQLLRDAEAFIQENKDEVFGSGYAASQDPFPRGSHIQRAVIGVPVTYTEAQRAATRRAALQHTTLREVHLLTESAAAALSYGLMAAGNKVVGVFDMGGGTLDVTLMKVADSGACQVVATAGHPNCGGNRIDALLADFVLSKITCCELLPEAVRACIFHRANADCYTTTITSTATSISPSNIAIINSNAGVQDDVCLRQKFLDLCRVAKERLCNAELSRSPSIDPDASTRSDNKPCPYDIAVELELGPEFFDGADLFQRPPEQKSLLDSILLASSMRSDDENAYRNELEPFISKLSSRSEVTASAATINTTTATSTASTRVARAAPSSSPSGAVEAGGGDSYKIQGSDGGDGGSSSDDPLESSEDEDDDSLEIEEMWRRAGVAVKGRTSADNMAAGTGAGIGRNNESNSLPEPSGGGGKLPGEEGSGRNNRPKTGGLGLLGLDMDDYSSSDSSSDGDIPKKVQGKSQAKKPAEKAKTTVASTKASVSVKDDIYSKPLRRKFSSIAEEAAAMDDSSNSSSSDEGIDGCDGENSRVDKKATGRDEGRGKADGDATASRNRSKSSSSNNSSSSSHIDEVDSAGDDDEEGVWRWTEGEAPTAPALASSGITLSAATATTTYVTSSTNTAQATTISTSTALFKAAGSPIGTVDAAGVDAVRASVIKSNEDLPAIPQPIHKPVAGAQAVAAAGSSLSKRTGSVASTPHNSVRPEDILARPLISQIAPGVVFHRSRRVISVRISSAEFESAIEPVLAQVQRTIDSCISAWRRQRSMPVDSIDALNSRCASASSTPDMGAAAQYKSRVQHICNDGTIREYELGKQAGGDALMTCDLNSNTDSNATPYVHANQSGSTTSSCSVCEPPSIHGATNTTTTAINAATTTTGAGSNKPTCAPSSAVVRLLEDLEAYSSSSDSDLLESGSDDSDDGEGGGLADLATRRGETQAAKNRSNSKGKSKAWGSDSSGGLDNGVSSPTRSKLRKSSSADRNGGASNRQRTSGAASAEDAKSLPDIRGSASSSSTLTVPSSASIDVHASATPNRDTSLLPSTDSSSLSHKPPSLQREEASRAFMGDAYYACIDEVVLVGGSSKVPAVRRRLRAALAAYAEEGVAFREPCCREFCTSIDAELAVSQGLAIRGAVLYGKGQEKSSGAATPGASSISRIKDLLMMDTLTTTIAVKVHTAPAASSSSSSDSSVAGDGFYYEPVLARGSRLPAKQSVSFLLDASSSNSADRSDRVPKSFSLEVFEEVELDAPIEGSNRQSMITSEMRLMETLVFPVPKSSDTSGIVKSVTIDFCMNESGELSIAIRAPENTEKSGDVTAEESAESERMIFSLGLIMVVALVLYLVVKLYVIDPASLYPDAIGEAGPESSGS